MEYSLLGVWSGYKTSETLLGIETGCIAYIRKGKSYKTSETLLGIETITGRSQAHTKGTATKPLKPF